ncbi:MAG: response regulator [Candidatus Cloacimonetes bacterium]|nr:response regulator [Candidatus Cloacimonadota bacterium]
MARILIVEDEPVIAFDMKMTLLNLNYQVCAIAYFGQDAIDKACEQRPDLVLMDINLNDEMDGIEAADYIQTHFNIPVVFITAYADKETLERVKKVNPYGYFLKPFDEKELQVNLRIALSKHKPNDNLNNDKVITRLFEFPERYVQAGSVLLAFINNLIKHFYPLEHIRVILSYESTRIRLLIETRNIDQEKIENILMNYGLLITEKLKPDSFFQSETIARDFINQLEIAQYQIRSYLKIHSLPKEEFKITTDRLIKDMAWLKNHLGIILKYPENNISFLQNIAKDTLLSQGIKNPRIPEAAKLIADKLEKGLNQGDEKMIRQHLEYIRSENTDIFDKLRNFVYGLIIKGTIKGLEASLIYKWMLETTG